MRPANRQQLETIVGIALFVLVILALVTWSLYQRGYLGTAAALVGGVALSAGLVYALRAGAAPKARAKVRSYQEHQHPQREGYPYWEQGETYPPEEEEPFFHSVAQEVREQEEERPIELPEEDEQPTAMSDREVIAQHLREMSAEKFEQLVTYHLVKQGYSIATTLGSGGRGANLIVAAADRRICVLLKRQNELLGERAVQEALGGRAFYGTYEAWLITNEGFTRGALYEAKKRKGGVRLIDGDELAGWLEKLPELPEDEAG